MSEQILTYMAKHIISGLKSDHVLQHMSDFAAGKMSEHMPTRTTEHSPEHFPAFMVDDVSD